MRPPGNIIAAREGGCVELMQERGMSKWSSENDNLVIFSRTVVESDSRTERKCIPKNKLRIWYNNRFGFCGSCAGTTTR